MTIIIPVAWDACYVLLSYILSFLGSYLAVCLSEQFRLSTLDNLTFIGPTALKFLMSISIAVVAIWGMHFVGMGALILSVSDSEEIIPVKFDFILTVVSLIAAVLCVHAGISISTNDRVFIRDAEEFGTMMISDASNLSIKEARSKVRILALALFKGLKPIVSGGFVTGGGVCVMHYVGMMAQVFQITMRWNPGIISLSVIIAVVVSCIAFWIMFRLLPMFPSSDILRILCALVMGGAVCGMHYTGMHASQYILATATNPILSIAVDSKVAVLSALMISLISISMLIICLQAVSRERLRLHMVSNRRSSTSVTEIGFSKKKRHSSNVISPSADVNDTRYSRKPSQPPLEKAGGEAVKRNSISHPSQYGQTRLLYHASESLPDDIANNNNNPNSHASNNTPTRSGYNIYEEQRFLPMPPFLSNNNNSNDCQIESFRKNDYNDNNINNGSTEMISKV